MEILDVQQNVETEQKGRWDGNEKWYLGMW